MSSGKPRNPFDTAEKPARSLFERTERPQDRDARSLSPEDDSENAERSGRDRRGRRRGDRADRYVPSSRSPRRRNGGGRRRRERNDSGRQAGNARTKKTQEELDQEMEDYWGTSNAAPAAAPAPATSNGMETTQLNAPAPAANADEDIDMNIE